jgi:hypothetical protein
MRMVKMAFPPTECEDFIINIPLDLPPIEWPECCIYMVPKKLRNVSEQAYTPKLVSIGPFHQGQKELRDMEMYKLRYFKDFCDRTGKSQGDLIKIIKDKEATIRHCYSEDCGLNSKDFVKMILLDAIFIIELFWRKEHAKNDYIENKPWLANGIRLDLILLENQLPFFVLEKLYKFAGPDYHKAQNGDQIKKITFLELSNHYFSRKGMEPPESFNIKEVKHFTDLIRYFFCSKLDDAGLKFEAVKDISRYCATKLNDAGLKFKRGKERGLLQIKFFKNGCLGHLPFDCSCLLTCLPCLKCFQCLEHRQHILEVPQLLIDDDTEAHFRNLMALEQCHYPFKAYICNYVEVLNTEKDVDLLVDEKIIVNKIGSNAAVTTLINKLCDQIFIEDKSCYYDLAQKLNKHYEHPLNHILATMTRVYFRDFWRGIATVVGLVVLGLTFWNFFGFFFKRF